VSPALNNRPGVSDVTRRRIRKVAEQMGWTPNMEALSQPTPAPSLVPRESTAPLA
jgi:DNA-binding LacI/PurR family transcriptional regulator